MSADILVLDDDLEDLEFIKLAFGEIEGRQILYFSNSFDLIKHLKANPDNLPSLIVSDYTMPKVDGFNLVAFLKREKSYAGIELAILTGSIFENEKQRIIRAGVSKIYTKPGNMQGYKAILDELLSQISQKSE